MPGGRAICSGEASGCAEIDRFDADGDRLYLDDHVRDVEVALHRLR